MRWAALPVLVVQLACLDAPPGEADDLGPICQTFGEWSDPADVPGLETVEGASPTVSGDGSLIMWETPEDALQTARWNGTRFEPLTDELTAEINTRASERNPTLSASGLTVWFTRGPTSDPTLYVSTRGSLDESFPVALPVSGIDMVFEGADVWDDGGQLFFSILVGEQWELASATCSAPDVCSYQGVLDTLATPLDEQYPSIRSDGLEMIYNDQSGNSLLAVERSTGSDEFFATEELRFQAYDPDLVADGSRMYMQLDNHLMVSTRSCLDEE